MSEKTQSTFIVWLFLFVIFKLAGKVVATWSWWWLLLPAIPFCVEFVKWLIP
jgi:hypothetical protein